MLEVRFSIRFKYEYKNFPQEDKEKIAGFAAHVRNFGFQGLVGRNKSSNDVPKDDPDWLAKIDYVKQHNLWHYHIGIPSYDDENQDGDKTSEYILHYQLGDGYIKILELCPHPPFCLPKKHYLE